MTEDPREYLTERERRRGKGATVFSVLFIVFVMVGIVVSAWPEILELIAYWRH